MDDTRYFLLYISSPSMNVMQSSHVLAMVTNTCGIRVWNETITLAKELLLSLQVRKPRALKFHILVFKLTS